MTTKLFYLSASLLFVGASMISFQKWNEVELVAKGQRNAGACYNAKQSSGDACKWDLPTCGEGLYNKFGLERPAANNKKWILQSGIYDYVPEYATCTGGKKYVCEEGLFFDTWEEVSDVANEEYIKNITLLFPCLNQ
jgi:hypothetical protein